MKDATLTEERRCAVQREREQHHTTAAEGYDMPKKILENAGDDVVVVCMDLQQALPTP